MKYYYVIASVLGCLNVYVGYISKLLIVVHIVV